MNDYQVDDIPHLVLIDGNEQVVSNSVMDGHYLGPDDVLSDLKSKMDEDRFSEAAELSDRSDRHGLRGQVA